MAQIQNIFVKFQEAIGSPASECNRALALAISSVPLDTPCRDFRSYTLLHFCGKYLRNIPQVVGPALAEARISQFHSLTLLRESEPGSF